MDMDMFLWQHVSRPCVFGRGKGVAAGKHLFFPLLLVWSVLLFIVSLLA